MQALVHIGRMPFDALYPTIIIMMMRCAFSLCIKSLPVVTNLELPRGGPQPGHQFTKGGINHGKYDESSLHPFQFPFFEKSDPTRYPASLQTSKMPCNAAMRVWPQCSGCRRAACIPCDLYLFKLRLCFAVTSYEARAFWEHMRTSMLVPT